MNINELIQHPEMLNRETLYELRRLTADYPYYQPARLLMLKNLYLLHDPSFDEELRRAAMYFTDRKVLFNLVEAAHYRLKRKSPQSFSSTPDRRHNSKVAEEVNSSRTVSLIDNFLSTIPDDEEEKKLEVKKKQKHRKPTAADATVDYVAYLLSTDFEELNESQDSQPADDTAGNTKAMNGGDLIDAFIMNDGGRITLQEEPEFLPEVPIADNSEKEPEEEFLTETLAGIYIKQGRFQKALDIMNRIHENNPEKSPFYDDQKRFLEKLIANQRKK